MKQFRLSKDDLRSKLMSRQHKPLEEYGGAPIVVRKTRPDGTQYVVGVRLEVKKDPASSDCAQGESSDEEEEEPGGMCGNDVLEVEQSLLERERRVPLATTTLAPGCDSDDEEEV